jgi:three-Cys-motif partner protein
MERLPTLEDDGLTAPEVGEWGEEKYQLVRCYADIFSGSMSGKWASLVYLDLFAGSGRATLKDSRRVVASSALLVLDVSKPFSTYVFSELDPIKTDALRCRVETRTDRDIHILEGNTNEHGSKLVALMPAGSLAFCFADPYRLEHLHFDTVREIAQCRRADFLVLLPSGMDANRNEANYTKPANDVVAQFTGQHDWRDRATKRGGMSFGDFVADEFGRSMATLGYIYNGLASTKVIVNSKNVALYRLAFFSKHPLGAKFWDDCRKYTNPQRSLF